MRRSRKAMKAATAVVVRAARANGFTALERGTTFSGECVARQPHVALLGRSPFPSLTVAFLAFERYAEKVVARLSRPAKPYCFAVSKAWFTNPVASVVFPTSRSSSA